MLNTGINRQYNRGFSMMEVLVAFVVSAIGLLGLAGTQTLSLKNINNSQFRSSATLYAYDMAERMRSNQNAVSSGAYDGIDGTETDPGCDPDPCTVAQQAQLDAYEWNTQIQESILTGGLPAGLGTVTAVSGSPGLFDIVVSWEEQDRSSGNNIIAQSFTLKVQL